MRVLATCKRRKNSPVVTFIDKARFHEVEENLMEPFSRKKVQKI
jgi:hypothetical protein